jgi:hypothetical protein
MTSDITLPGGKREGRTYAHFHLSLAFRLPVDSVGALFLAHYLFD